MIIISMKRTTSICYHKNFNILIKKIHRCFDNTYISINSCKIYFGNLMCLDIVQKSRSQNSIPCMLKDLKIKILKFCHNTLIIKILEFHPMQFCFKSRLFLIDKLRKHSFIWELFQKLQNSRNNTFWFLISKSLLHINN